MTEPIDRRQFNAALLALPLGSELFGLVDAPAGGPPAFVGPMVGDVTGTTARLWLRPSAAGKYQLRVYAGDESKPLTAVTAESLPDNDLCLTWAVDGLRPATTYRYSVHHGNATLVERSDASFTTPPPADTPSKVRLALGSCADSKPLKLWSQIEEAGVQGLVLLGDTPYIDSTKLDVAREKHRAFLSIPGLAEIVRHTPTWGTWDDHDFAGNDTDGRNKGKVNTRKAFVEYRAQPAFGEHDEGIYTKFRFGAVEVFLLDTRWFSQTGPSPVDPTRPTLLGKAQWEWLKRSLLESTAPFKLLACGMIWDDKENREKDDWGTYTYERDALFEFIGANKIGGVILVGGDIHCSRLLKYKSAERTGYPIHQIIVSPIHDRVIPSLNVPHPDLVHGAAEPHVWLKLDVDSTASPATLRAEWVQMDGRPMWTLELTEADLRPARA